jgi:ADP-heptose:LPS heptosyltransferase
MSAGGRVLIVRLDGAGDVLLAGPCVRAVAAHGREVTMLVGPQGEEAARLLPGVAEVLVWCCPWVVRDPPPVNGTEIAALVGTLGAALFDEALILTSFHQSPLPMALVLRLAGVPRIAAASTDYPGSLLDVRHVLDADVHEVERGLALAAAAGFGLPPSDDGRMRVREPLPATDHLTGPGGYVVVHAGATAPSRRWPSWRVAQGVRELEKRGHRAVVTGGPQERELTRKTGGLDLTGRTSLAELAAIVATPVVSLFSPVVPLSRWGPYGVPAIVLGDQEAACRATRAVECPVAGHPCLAGVGPHEVADAVDRLIEEGGR